ncbi:MAG: type II CRISPR-associated endonuclease Cas1 [Hydrotalea sp.]|nr:type II CRISPR-associated endonuclease Cas1 [Hydrotalea sp.]
MRCDNEQMVVSYAYLKDKDDVADKRVPIEDIGVLVLEHLQVTITHYLLNKLVSNNTAVVTCDEFHHPSGLLLPIEGHTLQSQKQKAQVEASQPLKKQLWQQTIVAKIRNQAAVLERQSAPYEYLERLSKEVKSGDSENAEGQAAAYYWKRVFPGLPDFKRDRYGFPPNHLLNYGYAILRATVARSIVASGLLPSLGLHHRNQYNAFCLADDIMEPYRPYVDLTVCSLIRNVIPAEIDRSTKQILLRIPAMDVIMDGQRSPLMNAVNRTTASLSKCYEGVSRKILYPDLSQ